MGFFPVSQEKGKHSYSNELLHQMGCKICPLNKIRENIHPHMEPTGSEEPMIYMLGEAPGEDEDEEGEQFIGKSGQLLRANIPKEWIKRIRWNNVVRTRPPKNRTPTNVEVECCRPSVEEDISRSRPVAVFGFGSVPLSWGPGIKSGIAMWRGRKTPIKVSGLDTWFYIFHHPAYLYRIKRDKTPSRIGSEDERAFHFDLKRAFSEIENLPKPEVHDEKYAEQGLILITGKEKGDLEKLKKQFEWVMSLKRAGFDFETNKIRPYAKGAKILTVAICTGERGFAFALDHSQDGWTKEERSIVRKLLIRFIKSKVRKLVHNLAFEHEWSAIEFGKEILRKGLWGCSMTQAAILDERTGKEKRKKVRGGPLNLDFLTKLYFGIHIKALSPLDKNNLDKENLLDVLRYNGIDGKYHYMVYMEQVKKLKDNGLTRVYRDALKRIPTCVLTQIKGVPTDKDETERLRIKFTKVIEKIDKEIEFNKDIREFGRFNPNSPQDVVGFFRDHLKRWEGSLESGKYSTKKEVLEKIKHPIAKLIIDHRAESKKLSTYIYDQLWPDNLLHQQLNLLFTVSSRTSSDSPNLQNVPSRDLEAKKVRKQISTINIPGHSFVAIDYGQIEFRVIGMISKAKALVKALWEGYDVHTEWAKKLIKAYPPLIDRYEKEKDPMRVCRKVMRTDWTFPLCFGAQFESVCNYLEIPEHKLEDPYNEFVDTFHEIFEWHEKLDDFYKKHGYVETMNGRRRRAPIKYNEMINHPVQGTTAEIVLDGMNKLSEMANETGDWYLQPILNIHDDLTFLWPDNKIHHYSKIAIDTMIHPPFDFINCPITLELSHGKNLLEMEKFMDASSDKWRKK